MKIEFSIDAGRLPNLMEEFCRHVGIEVPEDVLMDYSQEIRRARGRFISVYDAINDTTRDADERISAASTEMIDKVHILTRNFVIFCLFLYWPLQTTVYMNCSAPNGMVEIWASDESRMLIPDGFQKLV